MATLASKIINPFMPTLFQVAVQKIAIPLFQEFDIQTLNFVFKRIEHKNFGRFRKGNQINHKASRAEEKLLSLPAHLRVEVLQAAMGLHWAVHDWKSDHYPVHFQDGDCIFYWRPDGMIDRNKTAEQLIMNKNIDIRQRFDIAFMYCFENGVQSLWKEMEESGRRENFETTDFLTRFWIRRVREGCQVPWLEDFQECIELPEVMSIYRLKRYSSFFPLLEPKDRLTFLKGFRWLRSNDFRFFWHATTEEEEKELLRTGVLHILLLYLSWPLQRFFIETAEKLWSFVDGNTFCMTLDFIWYFYQEGRKDFDYYQLFVDYWNRRPHNLIITDRDSNLIHSRLNKVLRKRKAEFNSDANRKKWKRENGRLLSMP